MKLWRLAGVAALCSAACYYSSSFSIAGLSSSTIAAATPLGIADGQTPVVITVTAKTADGRPVPTLPVLLQAPLCTVVQPNAPTDANGQARGAIVCDSPGPRQITATVSVDQETVPLAASASVNFVLPNVPVSFTVANVPQAVTAGDALSPNIIAINAVGQVALGYIGTIHFSSTDPQADLPLDYRFQATDHGTKVFAAALKTAGAQNLLVTDIDNNAQGLQTGIAVQAAAQSTFAVSSSSQVPTSQFFSAVVTATDAYGNPTADYTGTLHFTSSDANATLPADSTLTAHDQGRKSFDNALRLLTCGPQTINVTDNANNTASQTIFANALPLLSGPNNSFCLDTVSSFSTNQLVFNTCSGVTTQQWQFLNGVLRNSAGQCVEVAANDAVNTCDLTNPNQQVEFDPSLRQVHTADGACLDAGPTQIAEGLVQRANCLVVNSHNMSQQQFYAPPFQTLQSASHFLQCLDVVGGIANSGTAVQMSTCHDATTQQWQIANGQVRLAAGQCLTDPNNTHTAHVALQVSPCSGDLGQFWTFDLNSQQLRKGDSPTQCAAFSNANAATGTPVQLADCLLATQVGFNNQVWAYGSASYANGGNLVVCLDVVDSNSIVGASLVTNTCDASVASQQWQLIAGQMRTLNGLCLYTANPGSTGGVSLAPCEAGQLGELWSYTFGGSDAALIAGNQQGEFTLTPGNFAPANNNGVVCWVHSGGNSQGWFPTTH